MPSELPPEDQIQESASSAPRNDDPPRTDVNKEATGAKPSSSNTGGCGCLWSLILAIAYEVVWRHRPISDVFKAMWTVTAEAVWPLLFHVLKLCAVWGGMILILILLMKGAKWLSSRSADPDLVAGYLNSFLPVKLLLKIPKLFTEPRAMIELPVKGETHWSIAPLTLLLTAGGLVAFEAFVSLPPVKASAARTLYEGSIHQIHDSKERQSDLLLTAVTAQLTAGITDRQSDRLNHFIPRAFGCHTRLGILDWEESVRARPLTADELRKDIFFERVVGTSYLGFCLERGFAIRTGRDLIAALPAGSKAREMLQSSIEEIEKTSTWDKVIADLLLLTIAVLTACGLWLGTSKGITFPAAISVSATLWTVLLVSDEFLYVSSSFAVSLAEANLLGTAIQFIVLQIWLLSFLPKPIGIGKGRCWLIGNGTFALLQVAGFGLALSGF